MRIRTTLAALMLAAMPLAAADPGPQAVLQTSPVGKILMDVRMAATIVAGDIGPKSIDDFLKTALGEKGFSGLDLTRPVLGYINFDAKDTMKSSVVLLVSISKEEDFLDLLKRCGVEPEEVKDSKGLYKLGSFDLPQDDKPLKVEMHMRIEGKTAFFGFNVPADKFDIAKMYKAEQLLDPKETALLAYKQYNERVSEEVLKGNQKGLTDLLAKIKEGFDEAGIKDKALSESIEKLIQSLIRINFDSKEVVQRIILDTATGEFAIEQTFTPKAGTDFARSVAARKPSTNQFAGLANNTTAGGLMLQVPNGMKEMQDLMVAGFEALQEEMKKDPPPPFAKDTVDELMKGLIRTTKSGNWDLAITMNGPDKDGHFVAAGGMSFDNALPIEKAIAANLKDFPVEVREAIKLNVDTIGTINIHSLDPPDVEESYVKLFGDRKIYFAFGPKGVYFAIGNGAKEALKTAIEGKSGPANPFDVLANPKRLGQMANVIEPNAGAMVEKAIGNEDKTISSLAFTISGGDALRLKFSMNLKILPRAIAHFALSAFGG